MKRVVNSSTYAQRVYQRTLHGEDKFSQKDLTRHICYIILDYMTDNPSTTFKQAYDVVSDYLATTAMLAAKDRLQSQDIWINDDLTLDEAIG